MELAVKIYNCLTNSSGSHDLLDVINRIEDKNILARVNEFFMQRYNKTPHEFIGEKFDLEEVYAISSTLKYIREPNHKNKRARNNFYAKIGYAMPD